MTLPEESTPPLTQKGAPPDHRVLGICPSANPLHPLPHDDQTHHSSRHHDEVTLDFLEEGQLLEDDPYLSNSMLKELGLG